MRLNLKVEDIQKPEYWEPVYHAWFKSHKQQPRVAEDRQRGERSDKNKKHVRSKPKVPRHVQEAAPMLGHVLAKATTSLAAASTVSAGPEDAPREEESLDVGTFSESE